ncbi:unnamed protein product [Linum trigynum]|uniref:Glabrous enhancer-binding protein-like DBD domain-containing protein n=1 Tax=Linum trigynum TaxID=586398 RepID=A0AAV2G860_9ROSI
MAKKRPVEENPPPPPESEEEEEDEEGSEVESESTDDNHTSSAAAAAAAASHGKKALDSYDTESDAEAESSSGRSSPSASAFQLKPVTPAKIKKPTPAASTDPEAATDKKKSAAISGGNEEEEEEEEVRKGSTQGRWSESDEIALLSGMIQYKSERGSDPSSDMAAFLDYIEKSIQNKVSKTSLATKVRRLKQKYQSLAEKSKADGEYPVFSKSHEQKSFELSKKIWGSEGEKSEKTSKKSKSKISSKVDNIGTSAGVTLALPKQEPTSSLAPSAKKPRRVSNEELNGDHKKKGGSGNTSSLVNGEAKRVAPTVEEKKDVEDGKEEEKKLCDKYPYLFASMEEPTVNEQVRKVFMNEVGKTDEAILKDWESRWKTLKRAELQLFVQRMSLINEQVKGAMDVCRSE